MIVLYVQNGYTGAHYVAKFEGARAEDMALAFMDSHWSTHAFGELEEYPIPPSFVRLIDKLYPTCEHGLSLHLCMGPDHYPTREQEMAMEI